MMISKKLDKFAQQLEVEHVSGAFAVRFREGTNHQLLDVSENSGTPKSSNLIGFSIINHPFWGTPMFGNTHVSFLLRFLWVWVVSRKCLRSQSKVFHHNPLHL